MFAKFSFVFYFFPAFLTKHSSTIGWLNVAFVEKDLLEK